MKSGRCTRTNPSIRESFLDGEAAQYWLWGRHTRTSINKRTQKKRLTSFFGCTGWSVRTLLWTCLSRWSLDSAGGKGLSYDALTETWPSFFLAEPSSDTETLTPEAWSPSVAPLPGFTRQGSSGRLRLLWPHHQSLLFPVSGIL